MNGQLNILSALAPRKDRKFLLRRRRSGPWAILDL